MANLVERLRTRPEHHRRAIALVVSGGITLVLLGVWATNLSGQFAALSEPAGSQGQSQTSQTAAVAAASPTNELAQMWENGVSAFGNMQAQFGSLFGSGQSQNASLQAVPSNSYISNGVIISDPTSTSSY